MEFLPAIKSCLRKYAVFRGRAPRSEYWFFTLALMIAHYAVSIVSSVALFPTMMARMQAMAAHGHPAAFDPEMLRMQYEFQIPSLILWVALFLPQLAVAIRRLHDIDRSGWWWLLVFLPIVGPLWLLVWQCSSGTKGDNRFGPNPLPPRAPGQVAMIEPIDAVKKCLANYVTFRGRASRAEFWFFYLFTMVVAWVLSFVVFGVIAISFAAQGALKPGAQPHNFTAFFFAMIVIGVFWLVTILPLMSVSVRRLHDTGHSGWGYFLYCIPLVGLIFFLLRNCERGTVGPNRYGPDPIAPGPGPSDWPIAAL